MIQLQLQNSTNIKRVKRVLGNSKTTIELNGKQYDARTGKIIGERNNTVITSPSPKPNNTPVLDGFVRRPKQIHKPDVISEKRLDKKEPRTSVNHTKRNASKSKALMRPAVKKPTEIKNDIQKVRYIPKPSHAEAVRISRAQTTEKSSLISKFNHDNKTRYVKKTVAHLPVVSAPAATSKAIGKTVNNELEKFEQAIKNANSHLHDLEKDVIRKVPFLKRVGFKNKTANLASMSFAFLLLVGFFAYQNASLISVKVASQQAGISAKMPGYVPAGYGASKTAEASDGKVSLSFHSNTDNKSFTLTQQASNWNSGSLLTNYVQTRDCSSCYQTWPTEGITLYVYDDVNATWVSGGIWYQIEGNAKLTTDQLQKIATSL